MKVNEKSWHWWIYSRLEDDWHPSVCKYVGMISFSPIVAAVFVFVVILVSPLLLALWIIEKTGMTICLPKWRPKCPLGKVDLVRTNLTEEKP